MKRFVLDCSVALGFFFEDEINQYSEAILAHCEKAEGIIVPSLFGLEIANALYVAEKHKRTTSKKAEQFLLLLNELPLLFEEVRDMRQARYIWQIARMHHLTAYDATYLAVAQKNSIPLATQDKALRRAAEAENVYFAIK